MKKILFSTLGLLVFATGCGPLIGPFVGPSIKTKGELNVQQPLKVDKNKTATIKKSAIVHLGEKLKGDDLRLYNMKLRILISELTESKRFEIVSPSVYRSKQVEMGLLQDISIMGGEERREHFAKIARALECDGVLILGGRSKKVDMGGAVLKGMFVGTVDIPEVTVLQFLSARNAETIWHQEHEITYNFPQTGIVGMADNELKDMLYPVIKPLVTGLINSFGTIAKGPATEAAEPPKPTLPAEPEFKEVKEVRLTLTVKSANLRVKPSTTAAIMGRAAEGEDLLMVERGEGWYKARLSSGQEGWISKRVFKNVIARSEATKQSQEIWR